MDAHIHHAGAFETTLTLPPDKAICHRALLVAAVAEGPTTIRPWPSADDAQRTRHLVQRLGVAVTQSNDAVRVDGKGREGLAVPAEALDCGESGTTLRLTAGLLAGQPATARLSAGTSLSRRPMRRVVEPLTQMGARIDGSSSSSGDDCYPPLTIRGRRPLQAIRYALPVASAQVKSAILLAGLFADGRTTVVERVPTRDHTERMLQLFGARLTRRGQDVSLEPGPLTSPGTITLPGDVSSAAFFLVAAACVPGSRVTLREVGLNPTRSRLLEVLARMGADVQTRDVDQQWEPRGTVIVAARPLRGITVAADDIPGLIDELPILMVAASCAQGVTRVAGIGELRVKETDRIRSMVAGLHHLGARVRVVGADGVEIEGGRLQGAVVESAGDHRTAMSLAVAGLAAAGRTTIRGAECVAKSFPGFFDSLGRLTGSRR